MAAGPVTTYLQAFSYPVVGYAFDISGCTENGTSVNTVVTPAVFPPDFVVNGIIVVDVSTTSDSATPLAAFASVDTNAITNNANSAQSITFGLLVYSVGGAGTSSTVRVIIY